MIKNYKHLTVEERTVIQIGLSMGLLPAEIAVELVHSTLTVTRELRNNGWVRPVKITARGKPSFFGGYFAPIAHARRITCVTKPRVLSRSQSGNPLWKLVTDYLKLGDSPQQVSGTLKALHPMDLGLQGSHETIYTANYAMPRGELRTEVVSCLLQGRAKRRPRARSEDRRGQIPSMVSIHALTPEIDWRIALGHWEGDLIKNAYNRSSIGTLVERTTYLRYLLSCAMPALRQQ